MRCSNRSAAAILIAHGASAMTDVSGFGLVGHLCEMLTASAAEAELNLGALPLYAGTRALAEQGIASTLFRRTLRRHGSCEPRSMRPPARTYSILRPPVVCSPAADRTHGCLPVCAPGRQARRRCMYWTCRRQWTGVARGRRDAR